MQGAPEQLNFSVAQKQNFLIITKSIVWLSSDLGQELHLKRENS